MIRKLLLSAAVLFGLCGEAFAQPGYLSMPWVTPKPAYYVAAVGMSQDDRLYVYWAMRYWNYAVRSPLIQWSPSVSKTNVVITKWPVPLRKNVLADATPGPVCFIRIPIVNVELLVHELGHCLGLDDRDDGTVNVMQPAELTGTPLGDPTSAEMGRKLSPYLR